MCENLGSGELLQNQDSCKARMDAKSQVAVVVEPADCAESKVI